MISFLVPMRIESRTSKHNQYLEVVLSNGKYILNSENANYSFGSLHKIFEKTFVDIGIENFKIKNCLLLGLGGGSIVNLIQRKHQIFFPITAVEIDPMVISLGEKYFNIDKYDKLNIINTDALHYVLNTKMNYDLIIVDLYINNEVPEVFHTEQFIKALKNISHNNTILLFNKLLSSKKANDEYNALVNEITKAYGSTSFLSYNESGEENKIICVNTNRSKLKSYPRKQFINKN